MKKHFFGFILTFSVLISSQSLFSYTQSIKNLTDKKITVETKYRLSNFSIKQEIVPGGTKKFITKGARKDFCVSRIMVDGKEAEMYSDSSKKINFMFFCWNGKWQIRYEKETDTYLAALVDKSL